MSEAQRAQFEHFARGKGLSVELDHRFASLIGASPYLDVVTHQAWLDWQAAYAAGAAAGAADAFERAMQYIRDWRGCDCGAETDGRLTMGKYNTECGHAIDCDYYLADSVYKLDRAQQEQGKGKP